MLERCNANCRDRPVGCEDAFCTSREAARLLNISVKTALLWAENGVLQGWKTPGGHRRIPLQSVQDLLQERQRVLKQAPSRERDGFEALLRIGQRRPDVLIADLNVPGMDGFRLIAALRESDLYKGLQIVVVSGHNRAQIRAGGGLPKDVPVLAKPIPFNSLKDIIEKQLVNRIE
jgi:excisionase family DNA binding protein